MRFSLFVVLLVPVALGDPPAHPYVTGAPLPAPHGDVIPYSLATGPLNNPSDQHVTVLSHAVTIPDAVWLRLYYGEIVLGPGSFVRVTSTLDGQVQELDAQAMQMWHKTSAYFNGDTVLLELVAGPQTTGNQLSMSEVAFEERSIGGMDGLPGQCGICLTDDRVPSNESWAGRLMPVGCSTSIYNTRSCAVGAGHCAGGAGYVLQFKVPLSKGDCTLVNPPVNDQFPVLTQQWQSGGIGNDWAVMTTGSNGLGQTPYQRYGQFRPLSLVMGAAGEWISICGYGADVTCELNQAQQRSIGQIKSVSYSTIGHDADVRLGSSGSGILRADRIIGIVSHCTALCMTGSNSATRIDRPDFAAARAAVCPECPGDLDGDGDTDQSDLGIFFANFGCSLDVPLCIGDLDYDGDTDQVDLGILLSGFGCKH
jgi:hypothetical protein